MLTSESLTLILEFSPDGVVRRRFDKQPFLSSKSWLQTRILLQDEKFIQAFCDALAQIHRRKPEEVQLALKEIVKQGLYAFTKPEPVQPY